MEANVESPTVTTSIQARSKGLRVSDHRTTRFCKPQLNESARARDAMSIRSERPLLFADWTDAVFAHYALDPAVLQPLVPFELDLFEGRA